MVLGLIRGAVDLIYLAFVTRNFRNPVPQCSEYLM